MTPRAAQHQQNIPNLKCDVCHRSYSKKEHLQHQRHQRTHTGHKPFGCHICGRSFSRRDALNRHVKVHDRDGSSSILTPTSRVDATMLASETMSTEPFQVQSEEFSLSPLISHNDFQQRQLQDPALFWPESEHLLQNIMSIDPALWEHPTAFIPIVPDLRTSPACAGAVSSDKSGSDTGGREGQDAISTLSTLLSNTVTGVTAPVALSNLTSRFLDSCLHMFFSTFVPMLPVIHRPTFVFRECSPPLLLNAIAIGSLYLGTKEATSKGDALWRLAHTAVATSWHSMINHRGEYDATCGAQLVQTALLSHVYAALAKSRNLRMTSQVFHGMGFYWARYCGLFDLPDCPEIPSLRDTLETKNRAWRLWVARETQLRSLLGLYILDGVISQYSGSPTVAQHMSNQLPMPSNEQIFTAKSPEEWLQMLQNGPPQHDARFCDLFREFFHASESRNSNIPPAMSFFSLKVIIEGLKSLVAESKRIEPRPVGVPSQADINTVLDRLREYIQAHPTLALVEKRTAMLRWHAICLDALVVTARGARRLCASHGITQHIFGGGERVENDIHPERHINKDEARRTLLHASEIQRIASELPLGLAHDPHVPGAIFAAATTYSAFALAGKRRIVFPCVVDWHVAVLLPNSSEARESLNDTTNTTVTFICGNLEAGQSGKETLVRDLSYELSGLRLLLRALSLQWGVCTEMEEVVDQWIAKCV